MDKGRTQNYLLLTLLCVPFIWALSNSMIIPILPKIQTALDISPIQAGLIITALSVPTALCLPITGFLSDRYGRVEVMIPTIILYGLGGFLAGIAGIILSYPLLLVARVLQGIGATGTTLLAMSYAGDLFTGNQRTKVLSYLEATNSIGKLASPLFGTMVAALVWYGPFFVYPILSFLIAFALLTLRLKPKHGGQKQSLTEYFHALVNVLVRLKRSIPAALASTFIAVFIWFGNLFFLSNIMATQFSIDGISRGLLLSIPILTVAITAILTGKYLKTYSLPRLTAFGLGVMGITLALGTLLPTSFLLYAMVALVGTGLGVTLPSLNTLIIGAVEQGERGVVTACYGSVRALGSAFGPLAFGWMMNYGTVVTLLFASALALLGSALAYFLIND